MLIKDVPLKMFYVYPKGHFKSEEDFKDFERLGDNTYWIECVIKHNSKDVIAIRRTTEDSYQYILKEHFKEFAKYIYNNDNIAIGEL